jgi:predicted transcriptional regulator
MMQSKGFNVLKRQILEIIKERRICTSVQIGSVVGSRRTNTCDCLKRLYDNGLVSREELPRPKRVGRPTFQYAIEPRGLDRLSYWNAQGSDIKGSEEPRKRKVKE